MIFASRGKVLKGQRGTAVDQRDEFTRWMDVLLQRAEEAGVEGEVPVAAVILDGEGRAIGHGRNRRQSHRDPLGHAELVALQQAAIVQDDWRFNNCNPDRHPRALPHVCRSLGAGPDGNCGFCGIRPETRRPGGQP